MSTYNSPVDVSPYTRALSATVNNLDAAVQEAFAALPDEALIKNGTVNFGADFGTTNLYLISVVYPPPSYSDGFTVEFIPDFTNTGASSINVNLVGQVQIKTAYNGALYPGDLTAGVPVVLKYSATTNAFHLMSGQNLGHIEATAASIATNASNAATSAATATTQATTATLSADLVTGLYTQLITDGLAINPDIFAYQNFN